LAKLPTPLWAWVRRGSWIMDTSLSGWIYPKQFITENVNS
jgi:hypothetical protein